MNTTLIIATLVGVLEVFMLMFCGFRLVGFSPPSKQLLVGATVTALFLRAVRQLLYTVLNAPFGTHMVLSLITIFLVAHFWFKLPAMLAAIGVVIGDMILSLGTMLVSIMLSDSAPTEPTAVFMLIALEEAPLIVATLIIWKTKFSIVPKRVSESLKG